MVDEPPVMIDRSSPPIAGQPSAPAIARPPAEPAVNPPAVPPKPTSKLKWLWILILVLLCWAGYQYWPKIQSMMGSPTSPAPTTTGGGKRGGRGGGGPAPVVATRARRGNIGVYDVALGAVTPINTVTVKSRVDGQLMNILYKEGDNVQKGQLLIEIDPRPYEVQLEQAEGQLAKDTAALNNARVDLARYETLVKQNAVPEQQLATQKATVAQDEGTVKSDQGQIDSARLNLSYCKIGAPITGRVGLRLVDPGNIIHAGDANGLVVITQMEPISVIFPVAEDQLPPVLQRMRAGQTLTVDAWDAANTRKIISGKLTTIDNQIDQSTGTVRMRADFDNRNYELFPNQFVNARLLVQLKTGVVLLEDAAIQRSTSQVYVFLVKPDSTVTVRNITVGTSEGGNTEITSGLAAGDEVVMTGVDKLQEGMKVSAQVPGEQSGAGSRPAGGTTTHSGGRGGGKKQ
jgi:membrane fusion protein, multidrug efflux system